MTCNYKMYKLDESQLNLLLNNWLRVFISLWLRTHLSCCSEMRIEVDIWFSKFSYKSFQSLYNVSEICSLCYQLKLLSPTFLVDWAIEFTLFSCSHFWRILMKRTRRFQIFWKRLENRSILMNKRMKSKIKESLHGAQCLFC